ncbi:FCD domain-containing protein [Pasteurella multocida]|uniref:FCD domain-containing protein n=1 Tax=Pasteurella multocida TaxID=747 RepID=UPI000DF86F62|nr:FCD domain-containing protein [Pasteurella multocida]MEB3484456.1 GntR family transcriptional regulator [Pasteurella multocida]MEB3494912.1 GntR family transcriptional regulator [Pasteurella multocida]SUB42787.1 Uxu operon regulator [Pasteurella multocida subsp. septica]HDR0968416.1 FCD domain-containing protein [Pasteurella multocida]HDR0970048.1 FCD domain-containing protein [Pasteurella multocida]
MSENYPLRSYKKIGELLKDELRKGIYTIGERLPPERDIAERFDVSRTVVREALIMLELENLISVRKGSGVYIINLPSSNDSFDYLDVGPFELLQARQLLESSIAEFAAIQANRNDIVRLKEILKREYITLEQGSNDDYSEDEEFHTAIAEITQNEVLIQMQKDLWKYRSNPMWKGLHSHIKVHHYRHLWLKDHEAILNSIQRKDPALAKKAMWQHLENVKQKLFELSDLDDPDFDGYLFNRNPVVVGI